MSRLQVDKLHNMKLHIMVFPVLDERHPLREADARVVGHTLWLRWLGALGRWVPSGVGERGENLFGLKPRVCACVSA